MTSARINVLNEGAADLRQIAIAAHVGLDFVELELTHRFANASSDKSIEIQYTFPMPASAVLLALKARVGKRELISVTKPRMDAQDTYDEAVSDGESAILVERTTAGMYSLNLGHLGGNEDAELVYRYMFPTPFQSRQLRLALPTCIAPRYGQPQAMEEWQAPAPNALAEHQVSFKLELASELSEATVTSPTHRICRSGGDIRLADETTFADRDFVALIDATETEPSHSSFWLAKPGESDGLGIACACITAPQAALKQLPRRVHFLLDSSGSMLGDSIRLAKEALLAALERLSENDQFAISAFGSTVEHAEFGFIPANNANKMLAAKWIGSRDANLGGTQIRAAIASCLTRYSPREAPDILILTDGEFWNADTIANEAARAGSRLFVVGIGAAPAAEQIHKMAERSGASAEFLTPNEDFSGALERMVERMRYAERIAISVDWGSKPEWQEPNHCLAWPGEHVSVFARIQQPDTISVKLGDLERPVISCAEGTLDMIRIGWSRHIDSCISGHRENASLAARSATLGLINDLTSMVMIDPEHVVVGDDSPTLHKVPQMLAAGWGGQGCISDISDISFSLCASPPADSDAPDEQPKFCRSQSNVPARRESRMTYESRPLSFGQLEEPSLGIEPLLDEAAQLLKHHEAEYVLQQLANQLTELMGAEFESAVTELEAEGFTRQELIAALFGKALVNKHARRMLGFPARRKLRRHLKGRATGEKIRQAVEKLLATIAACLKAS